MVLVSLSGVISGGSKRPFVPTDSVGVFFNEMNGCKLKARTISLTNVPYSGGGLTLRAESLSIFRGKSGRGK